MSDRQSILNKTAIAKMGKIKEREKQWADVSHKTVGWQSHMISETEA